MRPTRCWEEVPALGCEKLNLLLSLENSHNVLVLIFNHLEVSNNRVDVHILSLLIISSQQQLKHVLSNVHAVPLVEDQSFP